MQSALEEFVETGIAPRQSGYLSERDAMIKRMPAVVQPAARYAFASGKKRPPSGYVTAQGSWVPMPSPEAAWFLHCTWRAAPSCYHGACASVRAGGPNRSRGKGEVSLGRKRRNNRLKFSGLESLQISKPYTAYHRALPERQLASTPPDTTPAEPARRGITNHTMLSTLTCPPSLHMPQ